MLQSVGFTVEKIQQAASYVMCICSCRVALGLLLLVYVHISRLIYSRVIYATPLLDVTTHL